MAWIKHYASKLAYLLWLTPSGQVAHATLDRRLCRTRIFKMDNIMIRNRKEEFKELVLYTFFGNMTFVISIGSYAIFNVIFGINELIANALAWVFAVLFSYVTNKKWVFRVATPTKTAFLVQMFAFFSGRFITLVIEETIIFVFITVLAYPSMWVKLAAQVVVVVLNYVISKLFVFKNH